MEWPFALTVIFKSSITIESNYFSNSLHTPFQLNCKCNFGEGARQLLYSIDALERKKLSKTMVSAL